MMSLEKYNHPICQTAYFQEVKEDLLTRITGLPIVELTQEEWNRLAALRAGQRQDRFRIHSMYFQKLTTSEQRVWMQTNCIDFDRIETGRFSCSKEFAGVISQFSKDWNTKLGLFWFVFV